MMGRRPPFRLLLQVLAAAVVLAIGVGGAILSLRNKASSAPANTYLVSIKGLALGDKEYVDGFSIETWGVTMAAVCRFPPGWTLKAGSSADPSGLLEGEASLGVTFLGRKRIGALEGLFLIRLEDGVQKEEIRDKTGIVPATFAGSAHVGVYGEDDERKIRIDYNNLVLTPATACPPPGR